MSINRPFTKENLDLCLKELGKEFRRLNGTKTRADIILIGGAAILANYSFREMTYDIDAVILASSAMKEAADHVGDKLGLQPGWLNMDFQRTKSFSDKLSEVSVCYKTFSNILTIRSVSAEYLIAMKLMSGRQYKNDLSDIVGILLEHKKMGTPITKNMIDTAIDRLYKNHSQLPLSSQKFLSDIFINGDYEDIYNKIRENEIQSKNILLDFERDYPDTLKEENIESILEQAKRKRK